ncbi:FkbM family methyltransferase [Candidatus Kaiserbacteria bacterium]|nr:FkbM family methyltransferase [Candidatus Kaiserbacteria bacterium]
MIDLEMLIKDELLPLRLPSFVEKTHEQHIAWRAYGFGAWRRGDVTFLECVQNLLPGRFKSATLQHKLQALLDRELEEIFEQAGLYREAPVLFGKPFVATEPGKFKNWLVALKLVNEVILQDEYRARGRIRPDSIVVDAGANVGTFSALSARLAREGKVYAFEPAQTTFDALEKNLHPYGNATAVRSALGNRAGEAELHIESSSGEGNTLAESGLLGSYSGKETVPITTIDTFVREQQLPRVDFIKIDTEGFEKEILEGAAGTIQNYHPALALSAYHKPGDPEHLAALVRSFVPEYRCELKSSPELDLICDVG